MTKPLQLHCTLSHYLAHAWLCVENVGMRKLIATVLFSIAICAGTIGVSVAGDLQKGFEAANKDDFATALREWKPLAEQGNAIAQFNLGVMYAYGDGVTQDAREAVRWFRLAAEQGFADAQVRLGRMYSSGEGVTKDMIYAHMWLSIAASLRVREARWAQLLIEISMTPADISKAQSLARECVRKNYKDC